MLKWKRVGCQPCKRCQEWFIWNKWQGNLNYMDSVEVCTFTGRMYTRRSFSWNNSCGHETGVKTELTNVTWITYDDQHFFRRLQRALWVSAVEEPFRKPMIDQAQYANRHHDDQVCHNGFHHRSTVSVNFLSFTRRKKREKEELRIAASKAVSLTGSRSSTECGNGWNVTRQHNMSLPFDPLRRHWCT